LSGKALFTNALAEQTATLTKQLEVSEDLADLRHRQTLDAIAREREIDQVQIVKLQNLDSKYLASLKESLQPTAEKMVLDMLYFDEIHQREEDVAEAHKKTFSWVFEAPSQEGDGRRDDLQPPASFVEWLRSGKGCFWINGKAASGKSTLMKYINRHNDLELHLKVWGGSYQARKASFYFWNAGSDLQKSHEGLLRSLLYTVLKDQKHLASICFNEHIDEALDGVDVIDEGSKKLKMKKMTPKALSRAFSLLVTKCVADFRLCLLIDGLDEYSGDLPEICELFKGAVNSEMLKIVVASRPIPVCIEAFSNCPGLILEDLTRLDIHAFVDASLTTHSRMIELRRETPRAAQKLLGDITAKASGVFLWVILVTKSLLSGLSNFDTIDDLSKRLDSYPPELHALYKHMLGNMEPLYRTQASRLLQIAYQRLYLRAHRKLTTLQLCFDDDRPSKALATTSNYLSTDEQYKLCREMQGRLRSRCCGLLEVHKDWFRPTLDAPLEALVRAFTLNKDELIKSHVHFLHKTVVDFLREPEIWSFVLSLCEDESFEVNTHLMAASITMMKVMGTGVDLTNDCLYYAHRAEVAANKSQTLYLQELNKLHSKHPLAPRWWVQSPHWSSGKGHYTMANTTIGHVDCFASLAVSKGLVLFLDDILLRDPESIIGSLDKQLILQFVRSFSMEGHSPALFDQQVAIVELLFRSGTDPNAKIDDESTIWTTTFAYMHTTLVPGNPTIARRWAQLIDAFAAAGADLNIPLQTGEVRMTPLAILDIKWSGKKSPNPALSALTPSWEVRTTPDIAIQMKEAVSRQLDEDNPPPLPFFVTRAQLTVMSNIIRDCLIAKGAISKVWGEVQGASDSLDRSLLVSEETTPAAALPPCPSSPTSTILCEGLPGVYSTIWCLCYKTNKLKKGKQEERRWACLHRLGKRG
jgi:hypothetical protein